MPAFSFTASPPHRRRTVARLLWLVAGIAIAVSGRCAENEKRGYELPPGDAAIILREVSAISGREILFAATAVRGVRTNPVRGEFTPIEAVSRLLAGTVLSVVQDEKTGALAVRRKKQPPEISPQPNGEK